MSDGAQVAERQGRILGELAELGLSLARVAHARALAAETPEATSELALAFHRISRSVRQTLALEAKLERDRARQDREVRAEAMREHEVRVARRKAQVRIAVERAVWTEAEGAEAELLVDELDDLLEAEVLSDDFMAGPVEVRIERIRADLGLSQPAHPRASGDPGRDSAAQVLGVPGADQVPASARMSGAEEAEGDWSEPLGGGTGWRSSA